MNQAREAKREKWRQIIESQQASGQTAAAWCREHQVKQASFFAWKRRLQAVGSAREFVEVHAAADLGRGGDVEMERDGVAGIEICCRGGRRLLLRRGFDRGLLIQAIEVLEGLA